MIKEIKLPEISDNVETGEVLKVLVDVGDKIEVDQPLVELETEKATFEVPSTESGIIKEINVKQGDVIKIGAVILKVETGKEQEEKKDSKEDDSEKKESKEKDSKEGDSKKKDSKEDDSKKDESEEKDSKEDDSKEKDSKEKGSEEKDLGKEDSKEEDLEKEPEDTEEKQSSEKQKAEDKTETGKVEKKDKKDEDSKQKDSKQKDSDEKSDEKEVQDKKIITKRSDSTKTIEIKDAVPASPSVRRLARELGVDINLVNGSGQEGRISEDDIKSFVRARLKSDNGSGISINQKALPDFKKWGDVDVQPMSKVRAITGEAMTYAWTTIPMVTQFDKANITQLEEFRKKHSKKEGEEGTHLTITSILVKVCVAALKAFPQFNSSIDFTKKEIVYKKYFNIGVAVDTDRGLLVPVIKNVDQKSITEISVELSELAEKSRNKKISLEEMDGGNFTISNLGGIGGTNFTPIVYSPQVAILGVSRGSKEAVYINEKFESSLMLPLSLTYDHRIIDGADAARFLRWICEALENPMMMIL